MITLADWLCSINRGVKQLVGTAVVALDITILNVNVRANGSKYLVAEMTLHAWKGRNL